MYTKVVQKLKAVSFLYGRLYKKYTRQLVLLTVLAVLGGLFESVGIGAVIPLFSIITNQGIGGDPVTGFIQNIFTTLGLDLRVRTLLVAISLLFILKAVIMFIFEYIHTRIAADYERRSKSEMYKSAFAASWPFLLSQKLGHLESYIMQNMAYSTRLFRMIPNLILDVTSFLIYFTFAVNLSPKATFFALGVGAFIFILVRPVALYIKKYGRQVHLLLKEITHQINENFLGMKTIKTLGAGDALGASGARLFEKVEQLRLRAHLIKHMTIDLFQPVSVIFVLIVFGVSYVQPGFNLAVFVAVAYLIQRIFLYLDKAQKTYNSLNDTIPYVTALVDFQDQMRRSRERDIGSHPFLLKRELELSSVSFGYTQESPVLKNLNFTFQKGEMVGVIGPSGAGKTTLVDLLLRLFEPTSGVIRVDGVPSSDISLGSWRHRIGYVSQDIFLKNDTIRENIRFYDRSVSEEDIVEAARFANALGFIEKLPLGLDTEVGERGVHLSAGQRQRLVLARVLARKPEVLILDEATAALDNESEKMIKEAIDSLKGKMLVIIIAHRLTTILDADRVLTIDNQTIAETGKPSELMKDKNSYLYKVSTIV